MVRILLFLLLISLPVQAEIYNSASGGGSVNIQSGTTADPAGNGGTLRSVTFPVAFSTVPDVSANAVNVPAAVGGMVVNVVNITTTSFSYTIKRIPDNAEHGQWYPITWTAVE